MNRSARLAAMARQLSIYVKEAEALGEYHLAGHLIEALHEAKRCDASSNSQATSRSESRSDELSD